MAGVFISLDGIDGTGKSTQVRLLADWLQSLGSEVTTCADPGGTPVGDSLRAIVLDHRRDISPTAEALIFMASRAELVHRIIRPALDANRVVVSDRFLLANVVYQGHGAGLDVDELWRVDRLATGGIEPHLSIVIDLNVAEAIARRGRQPDRLERRDREYFERVRAGFQAEASRRPEIIRVVPGDGSVDQVQEAIRAIVQPFVKQG